MFCTFQVNPKGLQREIAHELWYDRLNISQASLYKYDKNMEIVQNWMTLFPNDFTYTFLKIETIALKVEEMFNHFTMFVIESTSTLF